MAFNWKDFMTWDQIPRNGKFLARISDNVLDTKDWGFVMVTMVNGSVGKVDVLHKGAYDVTTMFYVGQDQHSVAEWTCKDWTGGHPEMYHEVLIDVSDTDIRNYVAMVTGK